VTQPERYLAHVVRGLEHHDGAAVAQLVRCHGAALESGTDVHRRGDVLHEDVLEAGPRHRGAGRVDEQFGGADFAADCQPSPQVARGLLPQWKTPLLSSLSTDADARSGLQH